MKIKHSQDIGKRERLERAAKRAEKKKRYLKKLDGPKRKGYLVDNTFESYRSKSIKRL